MPDKIKNYINGKWVTGHGKGTIKSINPANKNNIIDEITRSSEKDVNMAVEAAIDAFPKWSLTPAPRRGEILFRAAELLSKEKNTMGELVTREMGKVIAEGLGDVQEAIDMAYYMGGEGRRLSGETVPSELPMKDAKSVRVPIGVFALITPWNFPVAIPAWKICPALVAGNTVVFKPSSDTPVCATRLVEIFEAAGVPKGVLNLVHGAGVDIGEYLVKHEGIDAVSFTGSCTTGEYLESICGPLHRHISTEMGGKNAIIVMDDADLTIAVEGAIWGGFGTSGQRCTAASRVVVHEAVYAKFISMFKEAASRLRIGDGLKKTTDMGPVINESQLRKILKYIETGRNEGANLILGGNTITTGECAKGYFIEPTIFIDVEPKIRIAQEEIFGPVVCIIKAKDLKDAINIVNGTRYGLSSSIYTQDVNNSAIAERDLDTGIVYINASTIGAEIQLPFGGTKHTGLGPREAGGRGGAIDTCTKWKVIYRDFSGRLQKAQIDK
jgi:aldehyde dehydrogenase (NAD+)